MILEWTNMVNGTETLTPNLSHFGHMEQSSHSGNRLKRRFNVWTLRSRTSEHIPVPCERTKRKCCRVEVGSWLRGWLELRRRSHHGTRRKNF
jgi:hypothetical protein